MVRAPEPDAVADLEPETEQAACEVLTLPCYAELTDSEIAAVVGALRAFPLEALIG